MRFGVPALRRACLRFRVPALLLAGLRTGCVALRRAGCGWFSGFLASAASSLIACTAAALPHCGHGVFICPSVMTLLCAYLACSAWGYLPLL